MKVLVIALSLLGVVVAGVDNDIFGAEASDLMKQLKESGVMDQFEKELKNMLDDEKHPPKPTTTEKKADKSKSETAEFIDSYVDEKGIALDQRILDHLALLPVGEDGGAKHFVHLTQVLDKTSEIALQDDPDLDTKVLDIIKRVKSLAVMKTSLNKLSGSRETTSQHKVDDTMVATDDDHDMPAGIKNFVQMLKQSPEMVLDMILPVLSDYELLSEQTITMVKLYGKSLVRHESYVSFVHAVADTIETLADSEGGKRMLALVPDIIAANDKEAIMEIVRKETEASWQDLFGKLDNSDFTEKFVVTIAQGVTSTYAFGRELLLDDMKMAIANTFLISQGLPAIKPRKLTESLFNLVDRCIKTFSTWKIDVDQYKAESLKHLAAIEKNYVSAAEFARLTELEQQTLIGRFVRDNMVEPLQFLWIAHKHITNDPNGPKCAESILCHLNAHMSKEGQIKQMLTKGFSLAASYGWTVDEDNALDRWKLYQAIWQGSAPETNCSVQYTPTGLKNTCHIFPWQRGNTMSLDFEHTEL